MSVIDLTSPKGLVPDATLKQRLGTFRDEPQKNHPASRLARARTWNETSLNLDQGNQWI